MKNNSPKQFVSIVVPVLNEQDNIEELIYRIKQSLDLNFTYEIIFIDDRSTDNTAQVIAQFADDKTIKYFLKKGPSGKAQALLEGFSYAKYGLITMIDSDLQYPPEAIAPMIEKMKKGFDIVIAERKERHSSAIRRMFSKGFNYVFARFLHNIKFDVQSGLKVFKKEIIERIHIQPFPWTFDLEFLLAAKSAGYKITGYNITFDQRKGGNSKVDLLKTSFQIGLAAILLKLKSSEIVPFHRDRKDALGPGFHYKGIEFIHFSDLSVTDSAVKTLLGNQLAFILGTIGIFALGLLINWKFTIITFVGIITVVYFLDLLFNFFLIYRSFSKSPEITVDKKEFKHITEWPKYTIFCPLYKEWIVVPQFVKAIEKMDYPKDKLEVQLLLEEDDKETIEHVTQFNLPDYIKIIVVPHSLPKTKPKACNYGLRIATGEYAVIYDAEDIPDTLQLKKAVVAFQKSPEYIACIQAKLNYYNKSQNLLTRLFTAEYSLWFDLVLTGLQSIGAPIPLGGTSNHFKVDKLREVKGWDSFNVTEDCDLGIRLAKRGYKTAIIDSLTMEEANSDFFNWINQRSRWIKGYIQTYLVHMRKPGELLKPGFRAHFATFQLVVGGKITSLFINPFMWITTAIYFIFRAFVGDAIEQFFPGPIFYMAVFSLIFGNFLYVFYYMIGCAKREQYDLIKFVFLIPFYWLSMSYAAWKGLIQLISNPHYWPKTIHGLHLKKEAKETVPKVMVVAKEELGGSFLPKRKLNEYINLIRSKKEYMAGSLFVIATLVANFLNFFFNAYLGRALDFENFAAISLVGSFSFLSTLISKGFSTTVTYKSGYFTGKKDIHSAFTFWKFMRKYALLFSAGITVIWLIATPFLSSYFNADDIFLFILFALVFLVGFALAVDQAYISGKLLFGLLALITQ
ncbi:MAG TPA: glycosyltransferase [Candidatus Woesebacteria bacterium]|nr:glycosyltransferase [Candidatus Woesebacteria bacterium]